MVPYLVAKFENDTYECRRRYVCLYLFFGKIASVLRMILKVEVCLDVAFDTLHNFSPGKLLLLSDRRAVCDGLNEEWNDEFY